MRGKALAIASVLAMVVVTAVAARISMPLPLSPVPLSAQTLAVLAAGILLGGTLGALAMVAYIFVGILGLPVFAGGSSGLEHVLGPTGGYLVGFVAGAFLAGRWVELGRAQRFRSALAGMALGHLIILGVGWLGLSMKLGVSEAFREGVAPFLWGGLVKAILAALLAEAWSRSRGGRA